MVITAVAVAAVVTAAGVVGAVTATASGTGGDPAPNITWAGCSGNQPDSRLQCGQITVPVDWSNPHGATTTVEVARLSAGDPAHTVGTLFFNPGGPGEGEVGYLQLESARDEYFPQQLRDRFDIVAVEPRGTGQNPPLNCPMPVDPNVGTMPADQAQAASLTHSNERLGAACAEAGGQLFQHLDTGTVARDMDAVRQALGQQKISFLGVSYGSMLAQSYAELFADHVRAIVADGVVDRGTGWRKMVEIDAAAAEDAVAQLSTWCVANATCALHDTDVKSAIVNLEQLADLGQIRDGDHAVRAEDIAQAVNNGLNVYSLFPQVASGLAQATQTKQFGALRDLTSVRNPNYPSYRSIICQDVPVPANANAFPAELRKLRSIGPTLRGYSEFWDIVSGCAGWPVRSQWTPHTWQVPPGFPPVLLLSGVHDVATPPAFADRVRRTLPGSRLLRWDGDGHTAWSHNPAARQAAVQYLTDLIMPVGAI